MKSERRHELQTNVLANQLGTAIESSRPIAPLVLGGLAVVVVAAIGFGVYNSYAQKANSEAWTEYYLNIGSGDAEAFNTVVDQFPSSSAAPWARQMMGDNQLLRGTEALYRSRAEGEQLIEEAIDSYKAVIEATNEPELRSKASIGLAQAYESLGKIDEALKFYGDVEKSGSQPTLVQMAAERSAWLRTDSSKKFYEWFATLKTTPDLPPALPSSLSTPPATPDITFPDLKTPETKPASPAVDTKLPDVTPPISPTPASPAPTTPVPATTAPAGSATPAPPPVTGPTGAETTAVPPPAAPPAAGTPQVPKP